MVSTIDYSQKSEHSIQSLIGDPTLPNPSPQNGFNPSSHPLKLDGLFNHLASSFGHYSKQTFLSLFGALTKLIRDHQWSGVVLASTLDDPQFEPMMTALSSRRSDDLTVFRFEKATKASSKANPRSKTKTNPSQDIPATLPNIEELGLPPHTGFLVILSNRICAALHWTVDARKSYQMYQGGWTFHPSDVRLIADQLALQLTEIGPATGAHLKNLLDGTTLDRRYDDKLNLMVGSLVQGLEAQNQDLSQALEQIHQLNQKAVDQERLAAIGQLCSVVAHEIRNPLGLIDLYAKLVEAQATQLPTLETPEQKETLNQNIQQNVSLIRQSIESLETILSELTQYSRPIQLDRTETDVVKLVNDLAQFYQPSFEEKQVKLMVKEPAIDLPTLPLDGGRIRQALMNLLKNALEVSKAGQTVTVIIASRRHDDWIYIKVVDQGAGVSEQAQQKLFTPYFSTKGNGTGLGLAHSRKILQAHGGRVELLSTQAGIGSTFAIILPLHSPEDAFYNPLSSQAVSVQTVSTHPETSR